MRWCWWSRSGSGLMMLGEVRWWRRESLLGRMLEFGEGRVAVDVGRPWWGLNR